MDISVKVWGDFACFSNPVNKVERLTYPFPPPSAARGILSAIYSKPPEFYWQIKRIEVLKPIRYISFKRNEIKDTTSGRQIFADESRTQRQTVALQDVEYRITAEICPQPGFEGCIEQLNSQALRRIRGGKVFFQPSLGAREFVAYFEECPQQCPTIKDDLDAGIMVYDIFDLHDCSVRRKAKPTLSLFHAVMKQGVVEIPPYDSDEVFKT